MSLAIDDLPPLAGLDPASLTAACDPEPAQATPLAGEATIFCGDGLLLGLRALSTVGTTSFGHLYLQRPVCAATPCTTDELSVATVTGWSSDGGFSVRLDSRLSSTGVPVPDASTVWPAVGASAVPAPARPEIPGAPSEIAGRVAYPYCGEAELGDPTTTLGCFRDSVLGGWKAELVQKVFGTEGGELTWVYRFDGQGAITRYAGSGGTWQRQSGTLILGTTPLAWDFDPWPDTDVTL